MNAVSGIRAQMKLAWHARSAQFILGVCILPWAFLLLVYKLIEHSMPSQAEFTPEVVISVAAGLVCMALGTVSGVMVWRDEPPRNRAYHWSLPVDTSTHDLQRVVAYGVWLTIGLALYLGVGVALLLVNHVPLNLARVGAGFWISTYLAGLVGFGISASFSTALNRPIEWGIGVPMMYGALLIFASMYKFSALRRGLERIIFPPYKYSLLSAVSNGGQNAEMHYHGLQSQLPVAGPLALWLVVAGLGVLSAAYVNRGRIR